MVMATPSATGMPALFVKSSRLLDHSLFRVPESYHGPFRRFLNWQQLRARSRLPAATAWAREPAETAQETQFTAEPTWAGAGRDGLALACACQKERNANAKKAAAASASHVTSPRFRGGRSQTAVISSHSLSAGGGVDSSSPSLKNLVSIVSKAQRDGAAPVPVAARVGDWAGWTDAWVRKRTSCFQDQSNPRAGSPRPTNPSKQANLVEELVG
jgi:hypothetical protein